MSYQMQYRSFDERALANEVRLHAVSAAAEWSFTYRAFVRRSFHSKAANPMLAAETAPANHATVVAKKAASRRQASCAFSSMA